jgi:hypothetical protein
MSARAEVAQAEVARAEVARALETGESVGRAEPVAGHRRRRAPDDHLCTCGRLREECIRAATRLLWS